MAGIVNSDNIWMVELGQGFGFAFKPGQSLFFEPIYELVSANYFNCDISLYRGIVGFVDGRHSTLAELLEDVVASQGLASQIRHFFLPATHNILSITAINSLFRTGVKVTFSFSAPPPQISFLSPQIENWSVILYLRPST